MAQPTIVELVGSNGGIVPNLSMVRFSGGSPNCASKVAMSLRIVGEPNESTITMVRPAPVMPSW